MKIMSSMTIRTKLASLTCAMLFSLCWVIYYSLSSLNHVGHELEQITHDLELTNKVANITAEQIEQAIYFEKVIHQGMELSSDTNNLEKINASIKKFHSFDADIIADMREAQQLAAVSADSALTAEEVKEFTFAKELLTQGVSDHNTFSQHADEVFELFLTLQTIKALEKSKEFEAEEEKLRNGMKTLLHKLEVITEETAHKAISAQTSGSTVLVISGVISMAFLITFALIIVTSISGSVAKATRIAEKIAQGDLTGSVEIENKGTIGRLEKALSDMLDNLKSMVTEMNISSVNLSDSASNLTAITEETNTSIQEQKNQLVQVAAAVNEMSSSTLEVANNAESTAQSAKDANNEAIEGKDVVNLTITSIQALAQGVENAAQAINQVGEDSDTIGQVVDVIKGIAEQTNLLALNAAIEAARAGEQGRGFAVVADEVRTLAQRTQESTAQIETMITKLQVGAKNAVGVMETGRSQAQESVERASQAGESLATITGAIHTINDMNTQIAQASREQSTVSEEININITALNTSAEQNTQSVEETTKSTEELASMATSLQHMISRFKV